ncbi:flagellar hook-length control protein FliK [Litorilituus lipolyticus]|uniref:Flagellar hook-length control protein FliK n=1 Tax=Litorilituus lipolyticus TaxID=2491017 RepID=A0A502L4I4_9GAMM|nr:flagellar hook-length control protein FliK [Litorilituus lipolyticus]TPH17171.1 flagellar hook-length control protein FliK [Litorilituus lipolyticus]
MQQVSASSILLSQDTDINSKDISNQATSSEKGSDFSSFVEQHMDKKGNKQSQHGMTESTRKAEQNSQAAKNESKVTNSGNNDHSKISADEEKSSTHDASKEKETLLNQSNEEQSNESETAELAQDVAENAEAEPHSESLKKSEQLITLLYNADNTLKKQGQSNPKFDEGKADTKLSNDVLALDSSSDQNGESENHSLKAFVEGVKGEAQSSPTKAQLPQNRTIEQLEQNAAKNVEGKSITNNGADAKQKLEQAPLNPILKDAALHQKQAEAVADYLDIEETADTATQNKVSKVNISSSDNVLPTKVIVKNAEKSIVETIDSEQGIARGVSSEQSVINAKGMGVGASSKQLASDERLILSAAQLASLKSNEKNEHTGLPKSHDEITLIKAQNATQSSGIVLPEAAKVAAIGNRTDDQQQLAATLANLSPHDKKVHKYVGTPSSFDESNLVKVQNISQSSGAILPEAAKVAAIGNITDDQQQLAATLANLSPHDDDSVGLSTNESNNKSVTGKEAQPQSLFNNTVKQIKSESQKVVQSTIADEVISSNKEKMAMEEVVGQLASDELVNGKVTPSIDNTTKNITNKNEVNPATLASYNRNTIASSSSTLENYNNFVAQQASEVLNHNVASDTAQIQKSNVQLHQETISIFRKDFADAVKDKVMLVISQKLQQFDISLDPPEFGNMQVRVNLQGEQAAVNFIVQNQQAKDALEQNMHKLKDMLAEQGVDVGGANVEQQSKQDGETEQGQLSHQAQNGFATQDADDAVEHILSPNLVDSSAMSVDYYA